MAVVSGTMSSQHALGVLPKEMDITIQPSAQSRQHWVPDHRDGFIAWLKGEFAAANAIIDTLCHHLQHISEDGEYDIVWSSLQKRRHNWTPLLYMQQFFSVAEVVNSLQQVAWRKQPQAHSKKIAPCTIATVPNSELQAHSANTTKDPDMKQEADMSSAIQQPQPHQVLQNKLLPACSIDQSTDADGSTTSLFTMDISFPSNEEDDPSTLVKKSKHFDCSETVNGKMVNTGEGIELYEDILSPTQTSKAVELIDMLRIMGKQGELGSAFSTQEGPSGVKETLCFRAMSQFRQEDETVQPIMPKFLESLIEYITKKDIFPATMRPDSCIINIFDKGYCEVSETDKWLDQKFLCILSLTGDCKMVLGHTISVHHHGEYQGPIQIDLPAGTLLLLRENHECLHKRAVRASTSRRMFVTFGMGLKVVAALKDDDGPQNAVMPKVEGPEHTSQTRGKKKPLAAALSWHGNGIPVLSSNSTGNEMHKQPDFHPNVEVIQLSSLHFLPQMHNLVPQQLMPTIQPVSPTFTGQLETFSPISVMAQGWPSVPASKMSHNGTGVFFPARDAVAVPRWQSGVLVLSPFSAKSNSFKRHIATEVRRPAQARRPPRHATQLGNHTKSKGNPISMVLPTPQKASEKDIIPDIDNMVDKEVGAI